MSTATMKRAKDAPRDEDAEVAAIVAQLERLDYVYDLMAIVWREIEDRLRASQPK